MITDEQAFEAAQAYHEHGSYAKAAAVLGLDKESVRRRCSRASEKGIFGYRPVLPGFHVKQTSAQVDGVWVKQTKEPGEVFQLPAGQMVKGVSALVDPEGREVMKWIKTRADDVTPFIVEALEQRFANSTRPMLPQWQDGPWEGDGHLMSVYPIADQHLGLLAWGRETGDAYDLKIGSDRLRDCTKRLVAQSPPSDDSHP